MYTVAVTRDLIARHFLIGGDWGDETKAHRHEYKIEVILEGRRLDQHGYLVDICAIEAILDDQINYYRNKVFNDLPEFKDLNPSIEHFAKIVCKTFVQRIQTRHLTAVMVKIWESGSAWAQYRDEF